MTTTLSTHQDESERLNAALGKTIADRREKMGFVSQREFSRVVRISNSHLRKIEAGEISPRLSTIHKIAVVLETDAADLVNEAYRQLLLRATR